MGDAKRGHSNTKQETAIKMAKYLLMDGFFFNFGTFHNFFCICRLSPQVASHLKMAISTRLGRCRIQTWDLRTALWCTNNEPANLKD